MSDDKQATLDLTYRQVSEFIDFASKIQKTSKELIRDSMRDESSMSENVVHELCEAFSLSSSAKKVLEQIIDMDGVREDSLFRIDAQNAITISAILVNIADLCNSLRLANYSLEVH